MSEIFDLSSELDKHKRSTERVQLLTPEDGLTGNEKNRIEKYFANKGVRVSFGHQLKVIRVYDQGYIFAYECTVNGKDKVVVLFASVYKNGDLRVKQSAACSQTTFFELMEEDTDAIQNTAVKVFPALYRVS